ncbi:MAG TPA: TonB-dependent receptor [Bryobacteraceae bacterium]|nr:TonB-dependent receptor [Bryobacteraceae bacterium]
MGGSRVIFACALASALLAQQDRGTFTGTVTDPAGAAVPNGRISIVHTQTNAEFRSTTNESGQYTVPNLSVGAYRLRFEADGFKALVREGVTLSVAQVARIDAGLEVGSVSESVQVTAEAPLLQTETPEVGTLLNHRTVTDLPLGFSGGRYAENFAYRLTPGVAGDNWESRINGAPAFSKEVLLDGASASIYIAGHFGESSPSMEALQEFRVQTSGMSAEYGRTGGGVFNFVMKSGQNRFHGSAMGQLHNEWADANTFSNNFYGREKRRDRRHNSAFSGGGPVLLPGVYDGRDKTFFYAAYERYKESFAGGGSPRVTLPLPEWWGGDLSRYLTTEVAGTDALGRTVYRGQIFDPATTRTENGRIVRDPFPGNMIPANRISQVSRRLGELFQQHYVPTVRDASGEIALVNNAFFPVSNQAGFTQDQFSVKVDRFVSEKHRLSGSYVFVNRPRTLLDAGGVWDFNDPEGGPLSRARAQHVQSWYGRASYDWTIASVWLNHLQVGFNRQCNPSTSMHADENGVAALGLQGLAGTSNFPEIAMGGNDRMTFPTLGYVQNDLLAAQTWQVIDTVSWMKGRHSVRAGVDYKVNYIRGRNASGPAHFNFNAAVTGVPGINRVGNSFASMLLGQVSSANVPTDVPMGSRYPNLALFVQDDFKVTPRLTVNLGLRWDYSPLPTEQYDRLPNFYATLIDPMWGLPGALEFAGEGQGRSGVRNFAKSEWNDFAPRVGVAWQARERTAIRAGYGIFYHGRTPNGWSGVPWGWKGGFRQENVVPVGLTYQGTFNWDSGYPGRPVDLPRNPSLASGGGGLYGPVSWDARGGRVGQTHQFNFNIQQELPWQMVFDVGYIGTRSYDILANELRQMNQLDPRHLGLGADLDQWVTSQAELPASVRAAGGRYPYKDTGAAVVAWQTLLPFPHLETWNPVFSAFVPEGAATYDALQVQLNKRFSHGVQFLSNYTFSKTIDNLISAFADTWGGNYGRPLDTYNLGLDRSVSAFDRTHWIKIGATVDLPFGRRRLIGGWTVQYIGNYSSGEPLGFSSTESAGNFQTNRPVVVKDARGVQLDWDSAGFDMSQISTPGAAGHKYFDTSVVRDTTRFERGNAPFRFSNLRTPWFLNEDFSLQKNFVPVETLRVQFRAEFLNAFNRHRFSGFETNVASPLFGQVTGVSDDRRTVQFGIRADW